MDSKDRVTTFWSGAITTVGGVMFGYGVAKGESWIWDALSISVSIVGLYLIWTLTFKE